MATETNAVTWPTAPRLVSGPQLSVLHKLARDPCPTGQPLASAPHVFFGMHHRTLRALQRYAFVEPVGTPDLMQWALTWRGRAYLVSVDRRRRRGRRHQS